MYSRRALPIVISVVLTLASTTAWSQGGSKSIQYQTPSGNLLVTLGQGNSIRYASPEVGSIPLLVTRPSTPVLCAGQPASDSGSYATVDPNGYLSPVSLELRGHEPEPFLSLASFPPGAQLRAAAGIEFGDLLYPVPPEVIVVGGLAARCVPGLAAPPPDPPQAISCPAQPDSYSADRIQSLGFELSGELQLTSRIIDQVPGGIYYEHIVVATGGPVTGIQLREQFPYNNSRPGSPVYQHSLNIDSAWACRASIGAQCSSSSISDAARGYAHLDSASLAEGACLRIVAIRTVQSAAGISDNFSGSLHSAVFYHGHDDNGGAQPGVLQSRLNYGQ